MEWLTGRVCSFSTLPIAKLISKVIVSTVSLKIPFFSFPIHWFHTLQLPHIFLLKPPLESQLFPPKPSPPVLSPTPAPTKAQEPVCQGQSEGKEGTESSRAETSASQESGGGWEKFWSQDMLIICMETMLNDICNCQVLPGHCSIYFFPVGQGRVLRQFSKTILGQGVAKHVKFHTVAGRWTLKCPPPSFRGRLRASMTPSSCMVNRELGHLA